jgi:flavin-binding protein dodecin
VLAPQLRRTLAVSSKLLIGSHAREEVMPVVKVLELLAESEESWEDAARQAVAEASKTVRGIRSVYMSEFQATVENDKIKTYRANVKISFVLESK